MTGFTSMIDNAANIIAGAFLSGAGPDQCREAAVLLADRQMLISPERVASLADMERIATVELLRGELVELERVARSKHPEQRAGMLLVVREVRLILDRLLVSPATPMPPEIARMIREGGERPVAEFAAGAPASGGTDAVWPAGDLSAAQLDGTACVRCGGMPAVSTPAGRVPGFGQVFACSPGCPRTLLYRVPGDDLFGDLVIEVPETVAGSGSLAAWLADRASLMIRHQIGGEYAVDVSVDLAGGFVAVSVDGTRTIRYSLVEASRTEIGGAS